jgi:hypothetical protein
VSVIAYACVKSNSLETTESVQGRGKDSAAVNGLLDVCKSARFYVDIG